MTDAERWAVFFEYLTDLKKRAKITEIINQEEGIAMAVKTMKGFTQKELDYIRESYRIKCDLDYQDEVVTAKRMAIRAGRREGLKKGREKGRKEGREEGREEGRKEGREEGREEEKLIIAKNLLSKGSTPEFVHEITGLSPETIAQL